MGEVMVARDESIKKVLDLMKKNGLDEEKAMKKIVNLGIRDYVADLYREEISVREAAEILQLNYRQTLEILRKKGREGNVGRRDEGTQPGQKAGWKTYS
jgi:predicted HTH domain antitoxin